MAEILTISSPRIKVHDLWNTVCLSTIVVLDVLYLLRTDFSLVLTDEGLAHSNAAEFSFFFYFFAGYIALDTLYLLAVPACVPSEQSLIIVHHLFTGAIILVPYYMPRYSIYFAITALVEINTISIIARRNVVKDSTVYEVLNVFFMASYVLFRLVMFPLLVLVFLWEWRRHTLEVGTGWNIVLLAPALQLCITALSAQGWIVLMMKNSQRAKTQREKQL